ncbi:MAG: phosphoglycerate kinase [Myxococcota bacterium]|jgi:phosphoglycerate kinase
MLSRIKSIEDLELAGQRVLIRVDLNCPLTDDGRVADDSRIVAALPTIRYAREQGAKVILCSHLGRPKGRPRRELTLAPVGERLAELLETDIFFPDDCVGDGPRKLALNLRDSQVMLLENLRFHKGEAKNDDNFARGLAALGQVYVNDAFGAAHRAHASVSGVTQILRKRGAGFLMLSEVRALSQLMKRPERPLVLVVGGSKVAGKLEVVENLLSQCDTVLIGGAMAYTFLAALGIRVGTSRVEEDKIALAKRCIAKADAKHVEIVLPSDHACAPEIADDAPITIHQNGDVPARLIGVDIGPETIANFSERLAGAKTIFWNGPMGVFENANMAKGTMAIAHAIAGGHAISVVGGGDSVAAVRKAGVTPFINHISTGGGASLELLEGKELPGLEALRRTKREADAE